MEEKKYIGKIVGGGLKESLQVRLEVPAEEVQEGVITSYSIHYTKLYDQPEGM